MSVTAAILAVCCLAAACGAEPTQLASAEPRFLFQEQNASQSVSVSQSSVLVAVGLGLLGLMFALLLFFLLSGGEEAGTGYATGTSYSGHSGGGQTDYGHSRGAADTWSSLSAVDWIALAQELYESADELRSRPCQQRLVCQLAAGAGGSSSGVARAAGSALDYLGYLQLVRLPADVQQTLQEYGDAARSGRGAPADCELRYAACSRSVSNLMDKYVLSASS